MESEFQLMINDRDHWHGRSPPLCPNLEEIALYQKWLGDAKPVYLLGMTKELMNLCDMAVDLNPTRSDKVLQSNWLDLAGFYAGAIIGDGVINLEGFPIVEVASKVSNILICRVFLKRQPWMKYAKFFPEQFPGSSIVVETQPDIAMVLWEFR